MVELSKNSARTSYKHELLYVSELNDFLYFAHSDVRLMRYNTVHVTDTFCPRLPTSSFHNSCHHMTIITL